MKKIIGLLLIFISGIIYCQDFRIYHPIADSLIAKTTVGKKVTYSYQNYLFDITGRIMKFKDNKKLIYSDEAPEGIRKVIPSIFISDSTADQVVLYTEMMTENMSGFSLYLLNGLETKLIGYFPLALEASISKANKTSPRTQSLIDYLILETNGNTWRISFKTEKIVIHPGTDREEVIKGDEAKFIFNGKKLKEVKDF